MTLNLSTIFNPNYYAFFNPDLPAAGLIGNEVLFNHFTNSGIKESRKFSPYIDINYYKSFNPDLLTDGLNSGEQLLNHFLNSGINEGRKISPYIDLNYYKSSNTDLSAAGLNSGEQLFNHLVNSGINEFRKFSSYIDLNYYKLNNPDLGTAGLNSGQQLFNHLTTFGLLEGRKFSPYIDLNYYKSVNPDLSAAGLKSGEQLFTHLTSFGLKEGRKFAPNVDLNYYKNANPDLVAAGLNDGEQLFTHLINYGIREGRKFFPSGINLLPNLLPNPTPNPTPNPIVNQNLAGTRNNDNVISAAGNDTLSGGGGIDTLTGGEGIDTFVLQQGQGTDIITDFQDSVDLMKLPDNLSYDDIKIEEGTGSNLLSTVITVKSTGEQLAVLRNIHPVQITAADFGLPPDQAGNSLNTAKELSIGTTPTTFNETVGKSDGSDIFEICPTSSEGNINVFLNGLSADANIELIKDFNNNGIVDPGEIIRSSVNAGTTVESIIDEPPPSGCVNIRVYPVDPNTETNYILTVSLNPRDNAGNTLETARNVVINSTPSSYIDFLGNGDTNDYYRFNLNASSDVNLTLTGLNADANVRLLNSSGVPIETSANSGTTAESISRVLNAGTYYVQVNPGIADAKTNYNLTLSATQSLNINTSAWTRQFGTPKDERSESITTDSAGNVYVAGWSWGVFENPNQSSDINAWFSKYDKNGKLQWTRQYSQYIATFNDIFTDNSDNVYVTGANTYPTNDPVMFLQDDALIMKYNSSGELLLTNRFHHPGKIDYSRRVVADNLGNIYITGGTGDLSERRLGENAPSSDAWVKKLNNNGELAWDKVLATPNTDVARGLAVDNSGNIYITGFTRGSLDGQNAGSADAWVAKYDNNGNQLWVKQFGTSSYDASYSIGLDISGNVYITGETFGSLAKTNTGVRDVWVAKYNTNGSQLWVQQLGATKDSVPSALKVTNSDNVYITGATLGRGSGEYKVEDSWVASYDSSGNLKWQKQLGTSQDSSSTAWSMAIDNTGNIYTTGDTSGALEGTNLGGTDAWAVKYQVDPNGDVFNSIYGYGLVNAAAAVAKAIGQSTFADVPNLGGNDWGKDLINAPEVWAKGYTGQGITVAVIDTGVDINHPDLNANIWRNTREIPGNGIDDDNNGYIDDITGWNFSGNNNNVLPSGASRLNGHGTHIAGIIGGLNNGVGVTGVAYNAKVMPIKIGEVNDGGSFVNSGDLAAAIRYAVDNGARVINMSIGWQSNAELEAALAYAASHNVITVSSSGNVGVPSPGIPAEYATQYGISVGAVDNTRTIANFSNGAGADLSLNHVVAPGVNIYSTLPNNSYDTLSGTSMAAPHVSGVVALMLSANPNMTTEEIRNIWTSSATALNFSSQTVSANNVMALPSL